MKCGFLNPNQKDLRLSQRAHYESLPLIQTEIKGWGRNSVAQHLPSMSEVLGSLPSTTKTKTNKQKIRKQKELKNNLVELRKEIEKNYKIRTEIKFIQEATKSRKIVVRRIRDMENTLKTQSKLSFKE